MTSTPTCVLVDRTWLGLHYLPDASVTLEGQDATINRSGGKIIPIGATAWTVLDIAGSTVGQGSMDATAEAITVCIQGSWVGGRACTAGYFSVVTGTGSNGVCVGNVVMCSAGSRLYRPLASGDEPYNLSAWLGGASDRDYYSIPELTPVQIVQQVRQDQYFSGPQDPARPRKIWIAPSAQAVSPTRSPTPKQWAAVAAALLAAGHSSAWYECPTNEFENGGWSLSSMISYWQECAAAILQIDPRAHVMGPDTGGIYNDTPVSAVATILSQCQLAAFTNHMENSHQNLSNIVALRQYLGGLKAAFSAAGFSSLDYFHTETGITGGQYGVLQPRREARQRTVLRFASESFGWAKENQYDFPVFDHHGSGLPMYQVDQNSNGNFGSLRAGAYALHVLAEALYGTQCSPTNIPAKLAFGHEGSMADSLFAGLHYRGTLNDVVVLAANGIESASVTLMVSARDPVEYWDGMGVVGSAAVSNSQITVPINDLLTYIFLPSESTVSVVDTDQGAVEFSTSASNVALNATVVNEAGLPVPSIHNNSFGKNNSGITGVTPPYTDKTIPATLSLTNLGGSSGPVEIAGFALMTSGPAWQQAGCSITAFTLTGTANSVAETLYSYQCPSAVGREIPSASNGNSSDPCTMTSFFTSPFAWVVRLRQPVLVSSVLLTVTATSYGGQPDLASSLNRSAKYHEGDPQQLQLAELQVYSSNTASQRRSLLWATPSTPHFSRTLQLRVRLTGN